MCEFQYYYVKPKHGEKSKLCYMDIDILFVHRKTNYIYNDIGEDVETRFDTSNYKLESLLPKEKN